MNDINAKIIFVIVLSAIHLFLKNNKLIRHHSIATSKFSFEVIFKKLKKSIKTT